MKALPEFKGTTIQELNSFILETGINIKFVESACDHLPDWDDVTELLETLENDNMYQLDGYSPNWFDCEVSVKYKGFKGIDALGGCSYKSYDDFKANSGYYFDMVNECINQINEAIKLKMPKIIKKKVNKGIDRIFGKIFDYYTVSGDVDPGNVEQIDRIKKELRKIFEYELPLNFEASKNI